MSNLERIPSTIRVVDTTEARAFSLFVDKGSYKQDLLLRVHPQGFTVFSERRVAALRNQRPEELIQLTRHELDLLCFVGLGLSNAQVAAVTELSESRIKNTLSEYIFPALGVRNRVGAVVKGISLGFSDLTVLSRDYNISNYGRLNAREKEILDLLTVTWEAESQLATIGSELGIALSTVKNNLGSTRRKLGIKTNVQAAVINLEAQRQLQAA